MSARNRLDLETDPRSIIGIREFDAPRELVFSAWTDPKHLAQFACDTLEHVAQFVAARNGFESAHLPGIDRVITHSLNDRHRDPGLGDGLHHAVLVDRLDGD